MQRRSRKSVLFIALVLLLAWESLSYFSLINTACVSRPVGILQTLGDSRLLQGLGFFSIQVIVTTILGVLPGITSAMLISRSKWLTDSVVRFLHIGLWIPFLVSWALPVSYSDEKYIPVSVFLVWSIGVAAIFLFSCHRFLVIKTTVGSDLRHSLLEVARVSIAHGLFISLISQMWLSSHGWNWFGPFTEVRYAAALVLILTLFFINALFRSRFDNTAQLRSEILVKDVERRGWNAWMGAGLLTIACLVAWQMLSARGFSQMLSSPIDVVKAMYALAIGVPDLPYSPAQFWEHLGISILEIFSGLMLVAGLATLFLRSQSIFGYFRTMANNVVPLTYVIPVLFSISWIYCGGNLGTYGSPIHTALSVALISIYPFMTVLWGTRDLPLTKGLTLALDEALPFAFVGMFYGEFISSNAGLGFFIMVARDKGQVTDAMASSVIAFILYFALSVSLRKLSTLGHGWKRVTSS